VEEPPPNPGSRFRDLDAYRVEREWARYEGNALRDLFRMLRVRFLHRHSADSSLPALEVGPGPGRFSSHIGGPEHGRVLLDLSGEALRLARENLLDPPSTRNAGASWFVRGDGRYPPLRAGRFGQVVLLGNSLGFAETSAERLLDRSVELLAPGGVLLLEVVTGNGERSRYLHRLPPGAIPRLLEAPTKLVVSRIDREGFLPLPRERKAGHRFRRFDRRELEDLLAQHRLSVEEWMSVAPATGKEPERLSPVRSQARSWEHLLRLEEVLGARPARQENAAALLVAARLPLDGPLRSRAHP
jgi:SAM-dependent methyltransferase